MVTTGHDQPAPTSAGPSGTRALEILVGRVLFWGGLISILIILGGFALHLLQGAAAMDAAMVKQVTSAGNAGGPVSGVFVSGDQILEGLRRPTDPLAIIASGLVLLLITPVVAVILCVPAFARIRDYRYMTISLIILAILAFGYLAS